MSKRETVAQALKVLFQTALPNAHVQRNATTPQRASPGGDVVLHDGDPGEPDVCLSPLTYTYNHGFRVELLTPDASAGDRAALDAMLTPLAAAIEADRTLGGLCDWLEPSAPETDDAFAEASASTAWAGFILTAVYSTTNPLL